MRISDWSSDVCSSDLNEADEPKFTQPVLYKAIEKHANPREIYNKKLLEQGSVDANLAKEMEKDFRKLLQERLDDSKEDKNLTQDNPMYRSEEHTSELQSLMRISYAVFCLKKKTDKKYNNRRTTNINND